MAETRVTPNERTALAQDVRKQPDGPGLRVGKRGEITLISRLTPDGARLFRERMPQFQAEAAYWEGRVGTVHEFRLALIDDDTRLLFSVTFDGDFRPYLQDIAHGAGEWLDGLFLGVVADYKGIHDPGIAEFLVTLFVDSQFFYVANPEVTVRDVAKLTRLSKAVSELLDAAS